MAAVILISEKRCFPSRVQVVALRTDRVRGGPVLIIPAITALYHLLCAQATREPFRGAGLAGGEALINPIWTDLFINDSGCCSRVPAAGTCRWRSSTRPCAAGP